MGRTVASVRAHIQKLREEGNELWRKLDQSLTIEKMWPDAFANGPVTTQVTGNPYSMVMAFSFVDGAEAVMDLKQVPYILWPTRVKEDINAVGLRSPYYLHMQKCEKECVEIHHG